MSKRLRLETVVFVGMFGRPSFGKFSFLRRTLEPLTKCRLEIRAMNEGAT